MKSSNLVASFLEVRKRRAQRPEVVVEGDAAAEAILRAMMPHQRALFNSTSLRDAVIAPRQTGKSYAVLLLIFAYCVRKSDQHWVLIGPTLKSLKRIYVPIFKIVNDTFSLGITYNKSDFTFTFPNGSIIYFFGADKADEIEKLRGATLNGLVVDEAQKYPLLEFEYLIQAVVGPALRVKRGRLILIGTPGEVLQGEFYAATCTPAIPWGATKVSSNYAVGTEVTGFWCKHCWTPEANAAAPHAWLDALDEKRLRGWDDMHPTWRREYLGQWVATTNVLVYSEFRAGRNTYDGVLPPSDTPWRYVLGIDLGSKDGTAMVVWAFCSTIPKLYEVYSFKEVAEEGKRISARFLANWYNQLRQRFGVFEAEIVDNGGLAELVLSTLAEEFGISWEPAEKKQKEDHIKLFNDDLEYGIVLLREGSPLAEEMPGNRWLKDKSDTVPPVGHRKEDPTTPNDLCDAALYAFRWCYHRIARAVRRVTLTYIQERYEQEREAVRLLIEGRQRHDEDPCRDLS